MELTAIIIAAGMGRRLHPYTDNRPKCLVPVLGRSILERQLDAFAKAGVTKVVIIRGYLKECLDSIVDRSPLPIEFVSNDDFKSNNVLLSLYKAVDFITGEVLISYSDIIFTHAVAKVAAESKADYGLICDKDFRSIYEGRTEHPLEEAEVAAYEDGALSLVGKGAVSVEDASGEYIGLMKMSASAADFFRNELHALVARYEDQEKPFVRAKTFQNAYLSDYLQHLIDRNVRLEPIVIEGSWREIDTSQDLQRAESMLGKETEPW